MLQRTEGHPGGHRGGGAGILGPWQSCPLPGAGTVGKISFSVPPALAAVRSGEAPSPFWLLSLGLKSPPECYLTPTLAPSLGSLPSLQGVGDSRSCLGAKLLLSSFPSSGPIPSPPPRAPSSLFLASFLSPPPAWDPTFPSPPPHHATRLLSRSSRLAYSKRHHNIGFY